MFWAHIDEAGESYKFAAKAGALACEVIGLGFLCWHCFDRSITVRRWALIFAVILAGVLLFHAAALRGLRDARAGQKETENRLVEVLGRITKENNNAAAQALGDLLPKLRAQGASEKSLKELARTTQSGASDAIKSAQDQVLKDIQAGNDKVKDTAIVPRWYLDGWMYGAMFMAAVLMLGILGWFMSNADDADENFSNIPAAEELAARQNIHPINGKRRQMPSEETFPN